MTIATASTETVVRHHLRAFLEQKGIDAIVGDSDDHAIFLSEAKMYRGKHDIAGFFTDFLVSLPARAIERFTLGTLRVEQDVAYITWCVGDDIPLGTDTLVVRDGQIVSQTFAMYVAASASPPDRAGHRRPEARQVVAPAGSVDSSFGN